MMLSSMWCCQSAAASRLMAQPELQHPVLLLCCANGLGEEIALQPG